MVASGTHLWKAPAPCCSMRMTQSSWCEVTQRMQQRLKQTLDMFSAATGLVINFNKSTIIPMHVDSDEFQDMAQILRCREGSFPQVYLGLPLSNVKSQLSAFAPLIAKADRYLAGWKATLLSTASRMVLKLSARWFTHICHGGLDTTIWNQRGAGCEEASLPVDSRGQSQWSAVLVAWEKVSQPKEGGGLGIKMLDTQNACLLLEANSPSTPL